MKKNPISRERKKTIQDLLYRYTVEESNDFYWFESQLEELDHELLEEVIKDFESNVRNFNEERLRKVKELVGKEIEK